MKLCLVARSKTDTYIGCDFDLTEVDLTLISEEICGAQYKVCYQFFQNFMPFYVKPLIRYFLNFRKLSPPLRLISFSAS